MENGKITLISVKNVFKSKYIKLHDNRVKINAYETKLNVQKELLSRLNQVYYWGSFCSTHELYYYLQLIILIKMEKYRQQMIKNG